MVGIEDGGGLRGSDLLGVELRQPPIVFSRRLGGDVGDVLRVGRPVEFIDMQVGRGKGLQLPVCLGDGGGVLDLDSIFANYACRGLHGIESAGPAGGVFDIEEANVFAIGGPLECLSDAAELAFLDGSRITANGRDVDLKLSGGLAIRQKRQQLAVGRPGYVAFLA